MSICNLPFRALHSFEPSLDSHLPVLRACRNQSRHYLNLRTRTVARMTTARPRTIHGAYIHSRPVPTPARKMHAVVRYNAQLGQRTGTRIATFCAAFGCCLGALLLG